MARHGAEFRPGLRRNHGPAWPGIRTLAFSPSYETSVAPGISPWTLGFTLDIPIETAGKRGYRITQARHLANAATLEMAMASWQVHSRVRSSLVRLEAAEQAQDILNRGLAAQSQAVQLLEQRLNVGQASVTEVELMRVTADQTALQLRDAQKQRAQALLALAGAVGVPEAALVGIRLSFTLLEVLPAPEQAMPSRRDALLNRADVLAALSQYQASESALQLEIARQYPDVHLGPGFSHGPVANEVETQIAFGISLPLPIFQHNQGPIAEAQAQRKEAAAHFNTVQAQAVGHADEALSGYRDSLAKLQTAEQLRGAAQRRLSSVQALFDSGVANRLSLVQAQGELATNELARAQAFTEAQLALGQLEDAMQRPADVARTDPLAAIADRAESLGAQP